MAVSVEKMREYRRKYYWRNRERLIKEAMRKRQTPKGREAHRLQRQLSYAANPEACLKHTRATRARGKAALIEALGGRCETCGFSDARALQIDHRNGDGHIERRLKYGKNTGGGGFYLNWILFREIGEDAFRDRYALLCANCHAIKTAERGERPGAPKRIGRNHGI